MSNFVPESNDLRKAIIFVFHSQKSAAESHRTFVEAYKYSDRDLSEVAIWVSDWFASKDVHFYWHGIHKLPERRSKCIKKSNGQYF